MIRSTFLVVLLAVISFTVPACSGFTQCDTVAQISSETARWICNSLVQVQADASNPATLQDATKRRDVLSRAQAIKEFLDDQAKISDRFAVAMDRIGELEQAKLHEQRSQIIVALNAQLQPIITKLKSTN